MSGIAGIIHFDGKPVEPGLIERMTGAMAHRGPDGINHWVKGSVALGLCILRTTPESLEEHQPLTNEDESLVLVMDGRVDNWEKLRKDLLSRGSKLRTRADAELVLRAYEIWGRDCLAQIDGDFALVVWDARRQESFCARDRMGNKPFNYHWDGKTLVFSSELHAILALPWVPENPNDGMLAEFLANEWYSRDETFWQGIRRLVAAHRMVADASGPRLEQYWEPDLWAVLPYGNDDDYVDHYRELFIDVVQRMSRSSQRLACEVSGGLDSSAIFAVAENLRRQNKLPAPGIDGYVLASLRPNNSCRCVKFSRGEFRLDEELLAGLLELAHGRGDRSIWRRGAAVEQLG
jgi:asparagine synthase (glutamine-hydrolysing)